AAIELPSVENVFRSLQVGRARRISHSLSAEQCSDAREQLSQAQGLDDKIIRSQLESHNSIGIIEGVAHDDDRNVSQGSDVSQRTEAIIVLRLQIQKHEARRCGLEPLPQFEMTGERGEEQVMLGEIICEPAI